VQDVVCSDYSSSLSMATLLLPLSRLLCMEAAVGTALLLLLLLVVVLVSALGAIVHCSSCFAAAPVSACLLTYIVRLL
jgi:hypothetical protein